MDNQNRNHSDDQQPTAGERLSRRDQFESNQTGPSHGSGTVRSNWQNAGPTDDLFEDLSESPPRKRIAEEPQTSSPNSSQQMVITNPEKRRLITYLRHLMDENSFAELMSVSTNDSIVVGMGKINGKQVMAYSHRLFAPGHSVLIRQCKQIRKALCCAHLIKSPLIGIEDFSGVSDEYKKYSEFNGISILRNEGNYTMVPFIRLQINSENIDIENTEKMIDSDFLFSVDSESMLSLKAHYKTTHRVFNSFYDAKIELRDLVDLLRFSPTDFSSWRSLGSNLDFMKSNSHYCEIKFIMKALPDNCWFFEIQPQHALDIVVGLCSLGGITFGILANNPPLLNCFGEEAVQKGGKFLTLCQKFNIPILTIFDAQNLFSGFERNKQHAEKLSNAFKKLKAPKFTVITKIGYNDEDNQFVLKKFPCDETFIWKNIESSEQLSNPYRIAKHDLSAFAQLMKAEAIDPNDTCTKICDAMSKLEKKKKTEQPRMMSAFDFE